MVTTCVDHCLLVGRMDFLFGRLYDCFSADPLAKATYLECLEPYMLNDTLTAVTPAVMKDFVLHYERRGLLQAVEACITHMDIASLDIHQVHTRAFNGPLYRTTRVSWYQKGKTSLDFTEARERVAVASAGPCACLHLAPDR